MTPPKRTIGPDCCVRATNAAGYNIVPDSRVVRVTVRAVAAAAPPGRLAYTTISAYRHLHAAAPAPGPIPLAGEPPLRDTGTGTATAAAQADGPGR